MHPEMNIKYKRRHLYFYGDCMDYPFCEKKDCVNYKNGRCILRNPEKGKECCLHYEDIMDSLRLKVDTSKGTIKRD